MALQVFIPTSNGNVPFVPHPHQDELVLVLLFFAILAGIIDMESCSNFDLHFHDGQGS